MNFIYYLFVYFVLAYTLLRQYSAVCLVSAAWSRWPGPWTSTRISCIHLLLTRALELHIYATISSFFTLVPEIKLTSSSLCCSCTFIGWANSQTPNNFFYMYYPSCIFQSFSPESSVNTTEIVSVNSASRSFHDLYFSARTPEEMTNKASLWYSDSPRL